MISTPLSKLCNVCGRELPIEKFGKRSNTKDGHYTYCKDCKAVYAKRYGQKNKDKLKAYYLSKRETLLEYKKQYYANNREHLKDAGLAWRSARREELREKGRRQYRENPEKMLSYQRKYYSENRDKVLQYHKEYDAKNKEKINEYFRNRYNTDINHRILVNCRNRVSAYARGIPRESTRELIGCSVEQLRRHIESLFTGDMNWDNYGKHWQIDHIIPCSAFDLSDDDQRRRCFHWTNLQPLTRVENNKKNDFLPDGTRARKHR